MKRQKKILVQLIVFLSLLLLSCQVFATNELSCLGEMEFSEEFLKYMQLEDKENVIMPRMYNIPKIRTAVTNPLKFTRMLGSASDTQFSLKTIIPENMVVRNQHNTGSCWAFGSLAALESTLALKDYNNGLRGSNAIVYDFSERHMEYATSQSFLNDEVNPNGFNRKVGDGGSAYQYSAYLTNGTGAIAESQMPFEKNEKDIDISLIQNKTVITQVDDIVTFPSYEVTDDTTLIKQQMKQHITNYGGIEAGIHGATLVNDECYNNETGALYCNQSTCSINHSVLIVGWIDGYKKENFLSTNQPANDGAWIIKNSWGDGSETYTLAEMKEYIFECFPDACDMYGWTTAAEIPDDTAIANFTNWGYTIDENNVASQKVGDAGFMYVSYEDKNIYKGLTGIMTAQNELTYENLYQHDQFGGYMSAIGASSKMYLASVFDRKSSGVEYLTHVSINAPETYTCKVFVNPDGASTAVADLDPVQLKAGESETFDAGYHTIEFLNPVKINGSSFVIVVEIQGTRVDEDAVNILMEFNPQDFAAINSTFATYYYVPLWNTVTVENDKCFMATESMFNANQWNDTGDMATLSEGGLPDFDTTIKAFTTSKILESIEVTTPPTNTSYVVGQDFDAIGMVVKSFYANGTSEEITDYTITNGTDLALGQTSVTISYEGKTTTQSITVVENTVESIAITTAPTNTVYWAGDDFDATGMVVTATYKDGTTQTVTDYTIQNGTALQNGQTSVTIEYAGKTATQPITVKVNSVEKIEITKVPDKTKYVVGQNFNPAGMEVTATYANGTSKLITNYTIQDGTGLQENQTSVTIEFEGKTAIQTITVEVKSVTSISVKTMPTKTEYIQNKEDLDLTGGEIEILYNDGNKETMLMTSTEITLSEFNNQQLGTQTITLTYQGKTTQFDVVVKELPKPENSKFDDMQGNVKRIRAYYYTSEDKKEYTVINVELDNIVKATENDNMEYYYHVSANQQETGITDWIKINELQQTDNGLSFEINTADISNYEEVSNAENLYLYIKEVATRNDMKSEKVTTSMLLEVENINVEKFVDGEKVAEIAPDTGSTPGEETDNTLASGTIPNAGKRLFIICLMFAIVVVGRIAYLRYKDIQIK